MSKRLQNTITASSIIDDGLNLLIHLFGYEVSSFRTQSEWQTWRRENKRKFEKEAIEATVEKIKTSGAYSPWLGLCPSERVICRTKNYRESLIVNGFNPRQRVVLDILAASLLPKYMELSIYAPEYITKFANQLKNRFKNFTGSEYIPVRSEKESTDIPHQDLAELSLSDDSFDIVISNEVFEHLPRLDQSLREINRVLRKGGVLIATFPFYTNRYDTHVKASLDENGDITYLTEPEYHGNPVDPKGGSLVFQVPGWDILEKCRGCGLTDARMFFASSSAAGIVSADMDGILLLIARKE